MSFITGLTRMWLTRTAKPFTFKNGYDQILPYAECENLGLYVHIPFCKSICNFCPYCKVRYSAELCDRYIDSLIQEIHIVGSQHAEHRKATSLYFGGGTPALAANRIKEIVNALSEHFIITEGIGLELHPDNVNVETLQMLKDAGVTKISIGIQSFCDKYQKILGRKKIDTAEMMSALSAVSFETVSMDFIFALPGQTYDDLKSDIDTAFLLGANHVAIYPFIDFTFTESPVTAMPKKDKRELLDAITQYCLGKGYSRNSIWTFSSGTDANYSSMTRDNFLGFGCSATSLFKEQFKINFLEIVKGFGMFPNKILQKVSKAEILQNARVGTAVYCLPEWQAPVWVLTGFACYSARKSRSPHAGFRKCSYTCCACYSPFPMIASAISRMEIGGNRRLVCQKAKRTDAVNGGAAVQLDH